MIALGSLAGCPQSDPAATATGTPPPAGTATATATRTTTPAGTETAPATGTPADGTVETLVSVPGERVPENMAFDADGNLYFGVTSGEVRRIEAGRTGATGLTLAGTEQVATLPGAVGVETAPDGTVYVAVATRDDRAGVWEIPPGGEATQLAAVGGFPNDILYGADRDRLLVTESRNGLVYAVERDGTRTTWLDDDRLDTEGFGANGLTRDERGSVYLAVTRTQDQTGRLLEVPVASDGTAGEASLVVEGEAVVGADGVTARDGDIYVAANSQNSVLRVTPDGATATVATSDDGLVFPSDVLFGPGTRGALFVCNFATQSPEDGAILRTRP